MVCGSPAVTAARPPPFRALNTKAIFNPPQPRVDAPSKPSNSDSQVPSAVKLLDPNETFAYNRDYKGLEGVAIAKHVPADEAFDIHYIINRAKNSVMLVFTVVATKIFAHPFTSGNDSMRSLEDFTKNFPPFRFDALLSAPFNWLLAKFVFSSPKLQKTFIPLPPLASSSPGARRGAEHAHWADDVIFAEQRLSGNNPIQIRLLTPDDPRADILRQASGGGAVVLPSLEDDLQAGSIFVLDYTAATYKDGQRADFELPENFTCGSYTEPDGTEAQRVLPRPIAFFKWDTSQETKKRIQANVAAYKEAQVRYESQDPSIDFPQVEAVQGDATSQEGTLMPIAIRVGTDGSSRVYTPADGDKGFDWLFAKLCVQIADFNCHEMQTHLGKTHLAMEPFSVATRAYLPTTHPLGVLLRAHTRFMVFNNDLARKTLIAPDGPTDKLLAGTLESSVGLARVSVLSWDMTKDTLPNDVKIRGMDNLPHYPYRDDGQLVWDKTAAFTLRFVKAIYKDDSAIKKDHCLQDWASSLAAPDGGSVKGMPSAIDTQQTLADILTAIIFTCGPQHSAINFTQFYYGGYALNMPLTARKGYHDIVNRPASQPIKEQELLKFLPNLEMTREQLKIMFLLSAYQYDRLGDYDTVLKSIYDQSTSDLFANYGDVLDAISRFQMDLKEAQDQIDERNRHRMIKYPYMQPSRVLNSICI